MDYSILFAVACILMFSYTEVRAINTPNCPVLYRRYSVSHSYCQPDNKTCDIVKKGGVEKYKREILEHHNHFRSIMAQQKQGHQNWPPAADMMELEWDDELAAIAQKYSERCIYAHDKNEQRQVQRFEVGQNIASIYDVPELLTPDWGKVVKAWFGEIDVTPPQQICGGRDLHKTGHFTALVWGNTFKVGCGYTQYVHDGGLHDELYVCDYGPGGNFKDECIYEQGPACSKCPMNTKCDTNQGLCKRDNKNVTPHKPVVDNEHYLFHCDFRNPSPSGDCAYHKIGDGNWKLYKNYDNDYLETVLKPGQNGTIIFNKKIIIPEDGGNTFCIGWRYRKGPNFAKDKADNLGKIFISPDIPGAPSPYLLTYDLELDLPQFATRGGTMHWNFPTEVKISFAVPEGATPQYINLNSVFAYLGRCKFG